MTSIEYGIAAFVLIIGFISVITARLLTISTSVSQIRIEKKIEEALEKFPELDFPIDTDDKLVRETKRINTWIDGVEVSLKKWPDLIYTIHRLKEGVVSDSIKGLLTIQLWDYRYQISPSADPVQYRLFYIASMQKCGIEPLLRMQLQETRKAWP